MLSGVAGWGEIRAVLYDLLKDKYGSVTLPSVEVGYTAPYASYVHELHRTKSKFLETPMRELEGDIKRVIKEAILDGKSFEEAMLEGGNFLKVASQAVVPVDTGFLRDSAYTKVLKPNEPIGS